MIKVIPLFSILNDDFKIENGRIFPMANTYLGTSINSGIQQAPSFIIFTDNINK